MYDETKDDKDIDLAGSLLLAHPHLKDPNFMRSVILLTAHEDDGSLGVVINRPLGVCLGDIDAEFRQYDLEKVPLYAGGPVNSEQIILAAWKIAEDGSSFNLYFGLEPSAAQEKLREDGGLHLRAFKGYAGWGEGQLVGELDDNAWVVAQVDGHAMSSMESEGLWRHLMMEINPELGIISMAPDSPDAN